jgi:hypothetical protein
VQDARERGDVRDELERLYRQDGDHALKVPDDESLIDEVAHMRLRGTTPGVLRMDHA